MAEPDQNAAAPKAPPTFLVHLIGWYAITTLVLGQRTGLLSALRAGEGTAEQIADRAGVDAHNALAWLRAMVAARHATHKDGVFTMSPQLAAFLGGGFPVDIAAILEFARRSPEMLSEVEAAIRSGKGVDPARYQATYGDFMGRVNTPTYRAALVEDWIGGVPGLTERLRAGGAIADIACGDGDAVVLMARAFPKAQVVGFDLDRAAVRAARERARREGVANVEFVHAPAANLGRHEAFDLTVCLDSWHHLGDPVQIGRSVRDALRPGGTLLVIESGFSGDLDQDSASPTALIGYAVGVLYCLQESLAGGGAGLTPAEGPGWVIDALVAAGYSDVQARLTRSGWRAFTAIRG